MFSGAGTGGQTMDLLTYFGLSDTAYRFSGFSVAGSLTGDVGANGAFSASAFTSTDFVNTAAPEPSAILLLGTCLLFIGGALRRKLRREQPSEN